MSGTEKLAKALEDFEAPPKISRRQVYDLSDEELEEVVFAMSSGKMPVGGPDLGEVLDEMKLRAMRKGIEMARGIFEKEQVERVEAVEMAQTARMVKAVDSIDESPLDDVMREVAVQMSKERRDRADKFKGVFAATKTRVAEKMARGERLSRRDEFIAEKVVEAQNIGAY